MLLLPFGWYRLEEGSRHAITELIVRRYEPPDRPGVRRVTYETGYMGEPPSFYWRHRASFADIWSGYYTDEEPGSMWVVEEAGEVLGYLAGCVDTQRAPGDEKAILRAMFRHGLLFRPGTAGFFWRSFRDILQSGIPASEPDDSRWPSHLHIDLLPPARGRGAGRRLMEAWFSQLREQGSPGCHLGTIGENHAAIRFFETVGFRRHGEPSLLPGMRTPHGGRHHGQLMVADL